ncbi:hypothetical protein Ndes2526B_g07156 [Nannochloris sp. 'desiccata']
MENQEFLASGAIVGPVDLDIRGVNVYGAILLAAAVFLVLLYLLHCSFVKWIRRRGQSSTIDAARVRLAAARGDIGALEALKLRLGDNFDPGAKENGFTALAAAATQKQPAAVLWLCRHGADVSAIKEDGWKDTPLHYAAAQGCLESVQVLLAYGACPSARNFADQTPQDLATANGHGAVRQLLNVQELLEAVSPKSEYEGKMYVSQNGKWCLEDEKTVQLITPQESFFARAWEGAGSPGTRLKSTVPLFRILALVGQICALVYIVWRALRTLRPGYGYIYSMTFWCAEFATFLLGNIFILSLWNQIERPDRPLQNMLTLDEFPSVDVLIPCYMEPVEVIEATVIAATNMDYPGKKLSIKILDDGKRSEVASMVRRLQKQAIYMGRDSSIECVVRTKVKNVPHHAKAGNINNCLFKSASSATRDADFLLVLDCDMIVAPGFLLRTLGHFYSYQEGNNRWMLKDFAALLQTPQDFWNVESSDPMVHCARFFYGPMLQGRDGAGACPCCGTGVLFRKDILVSLGGQAYGSITEDYNTAMQILSGGFATMFLHERLVFGMSPDDIQGVFQQSTVYMSAVPVVYLFTEYSPMVVENLWEFCAVFGASYMLNRVAMWWVHRGAEGGDQELWRGSQMWVWMAPNNIKAICKVLVAELPLLRRLTEITFTVTSKDKKSNSSNFTSALAATWPFLLFYAAYFAGAVYFIVNAALGRYSAWQIVIYISALAWGFLIVLCVWPPVSTLVPRVETENGWKIQWNQFFSSEEYSRDTQGRVVKTNPPIVAAAGPVPSPSDERKKEPLTGLELDSLAAKFAKDGSESSMGYSMNLAIDDGKEIEVSPFDESESESDEVQEGFTDDLTSARQPREHQDRTQSTTSGMMPFSIDLKTVFSSQATHSQYLSNIGRVNLPQRTAQALATSAFLTSMILPEPSFNDTSGPVNTASGNASPAGNRLVSFNPSQPNFQFSSPNLESYPARSVFFSDLEVIPDGLEASPAAMEAGSHQLPQRSVAVIGELIGAPDLQGTMRGQSPVQSQQKTIQQHNQQVTNSRLMSTSTTMPAREAQSAVMSSMQPRMQQLPEHFSLGASSRLNVLMKTCANMTEYASFRPGSSLLLPVIPSNVFEHTIAARPSFEHRQAPRRNFMFIFVNGIMLAGIIAGAILDVYVKTD